MARTQAADYELRREAILDQAARLYAAHGYLGSSLADLAKVCRISKSLIYHYHGSKQDILYELIHSQVQKVLEIARRLSEQRMPPEDKIREFNRQLVGLLYRDKANRHRIALNERHHLSKPRQAIVQKLQRELVALVEDMLANLRSTKALPVRARTPVAMFLFGSIAWTYTWLDPEGPLSLDKIADILSEIFIHGIEKAKFPD